MHYFTLLRRIKATLKKKNNLGAVNFFFFWILRKRHISDKMYIYLFYYLYKFNLPILTFFKKKIFLTFILEKVNSDFAVTFQSVEKTRL